MCVGGEGARRSEWYGDNPVLPEQGARLGTPPTLIKKYYEAAAPQGIEKNWPLSEAVKAFVVENRCHILEVGPCSCVKCGVAKLFFDDRTMMTYAHIRDNMADVRASRATRVAQTSAGRRVRARARRRLT